ncbi:MAG: DUF3857 domain-containing protein [Acidobacteriota bacterium]
MRNALFALSCVAVALSPAAALCQEAVALWDRPPLEAGVDEVLQAFAALPEPEEADVQFLTSQKTYSFDHMGRLTLTRHTIFKILTEEGLDRYATARLSYSPWHQARPEFGYRVIAPEGTESPLDTTTLSERPIASESVDIFEDRRVVEAPLPAVRVGSIVEGVRVLSDLEPFFSAGTVHLSYLQSSSGPIHFFRTQVEHPEDLALSFVVRKWEDLKPEKAQDDGVIRYRFEAFDLPRSESPVSGLPPELSRWSYLGLTTAPSWQAVAMAYSELVESRLQEQNLPRRVGVEKGATRQEKIEQILEWTHDQVRYTGLELGAAAIVPVSPETTLARSYGDCKDKSTLLVSLLRREGIAAQVALLRASLGADLDPDLPGLGQMNHAIVYLPEDDLWIDPTDPFSRAGELPAQDQGRWALIASESTTELVRTPSSTADQNTVRMEVRVQLGSQGPASLTEVSTYGGAQEGAIRANLQSLTDDQLREVYESVTESRYLAEELGEVEVSSADDLSVPFRTELSARKVGRGVTAIDDALYAILPIEVLSDLPDSLLTPRPEDDEPRTEDFDFGVPFSTEVKFDLRAPTGMVVREVPATEEILWKGGHFRKVFQATPTGLEAVYSLRVGERVLSGDEFESLRSQIADVGEEADIVYFDHSAIASLAAGRTLEAVASFQELLRQDPKDAVNRARFARVLVGLGMGAEARRVADEAVRLDPESSLALRARGEVYQYDEIGRLFGPGADVPAARQSMARAAELDPENQWIRQIHAILFDYDDAGHRYSSSAPLEEAVAAHRAYREDFDNALDVNLLSALFALDRFEEVVAEAVDVAEDPARNSLLVSALAVTEGADAALAKAEQLTRNQEEFTQLVSDAANRLLGARQYPEASRVLARAAAGVGDPTTVLNQARIVGKMEPLALTGAPTTIEVLSQQLLAAIYVPEVDVESLRPLLHRRLLEHLDEAGPTGVEDAFKGEYAGTKVPESMRQEAFVDLAIASWDLAVEGDEKRGARVTVTNSRFGFSTSLVYFAKFGPEGPRIIATLTSLSPVADLVLDLLAEDRLEEGAHWLALIGELFEDVSVSEDPLQADALLTFFPSAEERSPEVLRLGAAVTYASTGDWESTVSAAEPLRKAELAPDQKAMADLTLATGYLSTDRFDSAQELFESLVERFPSSESGVAGLAEVHLMKGDWDSLERLARPYLESSDMKALGWLMLQSVAVGRGDRAAVQESVRALESLDKADGLIYNNAAWAELFVEPVSEEALNLALQAMDDEAAPSPAVLHTVATVFASLDRPQEAYRVMLQTLASRQSIEVETKDWYCFGRIAEAYGLNEAALRFYHRVEPPESPTGMSTHELARRRIAALTTPEVN